jgi:hypothetical protein
MPTKAAPICRELRARIKGRLWDLLALAVRHDCKPVSLAVKDDSIRVAVSIGPAGEVVAAERFPGLHFSPIEAAIWNALREGPMPGKALARATSQKYTPNFRWTLSNLRTRRVLAHNRADGGYRRVSEKGVAHAS